MGFLVVTGIMFMAFFMSAVLSQSGDEDDGPPDDGMMIPVVNNA